MCTIEYNQAKHYRQAEQQGERLGNGWEAEADRDTTAQKRVTSLALQLHA
jgi:hypothetical protein